MSGAACGQAKGRGGEEARMCACCLVEVGIKKCSGCHRVLYCSVACQKSHWKGGHKALCAELAHEYALSKNMAAMENLEENEFEKAQKQLEKVHQVVQEHARRETTIGTSSGGSYMLSAHILHTEGKNAEALEKITQGIQILRKELGNDHEIIAVSLELVGDIYHDQGKYELALRKYQQALEIFVKANGPETPEVARVCSHMGQSFFDLDHQDKAIEVLERALKIERKTDTTEGAVLSGTLFHIGKCLMRQNKPGLALSRFEEALQILLRVHGPEHEHVARTYQCIGSCSCDTGQLDKALEYLNKALAIQVKTLGRDHIDAAVTQHGIARVYEAQGAFTQSQELFLGCAEVFSKFHGADHYITQEAFRNARLVGTKAAYSEPAFFASRQYQHLFQDTSRDANVCAAGGRR